MSCNIIRNKENQITKVTDQEGNESILFNKIVRSPLILDSEQALSVYQNVYSDKLADKNEADLEFTYKIGDTLTTSYREALKAVKNGEEIQAGFLSEGRFLKIMSTEKNINKDTQIGYINSAIEDGLLSDEKIRVGNEYRFVAEGEGELKQAINSEITVNDAGSYLGYSGLQRDAQSLKLVKTKDKTQVVDKQGNISLISTQEFNEMSIDDINKNFDYADELVAGKFFADNRPAQRDTVITEDKVLHRTEKELQLRLMNFLNKLGVNVTSISNYVQNYTIKNGVAPNAQALADISNRVIAFNSGITTLQDLTEETAHFITESMPKAQTEDILRNIHKSDEWQQYSDTYRQVYSKEYQGEELEQAVRREILGKIVANSIADNFSQENKSETQKNFIQKALDFVTSFFSTINAYFKPEYVNELNDYLEDVENLLLKDDLSFESTSLEENPFRFYALDPNPDSPENKLILKAKKTAEEISKVGRALKKNGAISKTDQLKLTKLQNDLETTASIQSVATLVSISNNIANYISKALEDSAKNNKNYALSQEEVVIYDYMKDHALGAMGEIKELVKDKEGKDWETLRARIGETQEMMIKVISTKNLVSNQTVNNLIDEILKRGGYPDSHRQFLEKHINNLDADVSLLAAHAGTLVNSKNPLLGLLSRSTTNMHNEGHQSNQNALKKFQNIIKKNGFTEKIIGAFGSKDGYIESQYDFKAYEEEHNKTYVEAFRQVIPDSTLSDEEIIQKRDNRTLEIDEQQRANINRIERNLALERDLDEKPRVKSYYEEQNKKYTDAGISEDTIIWNSSYLSSVGNILKNAKNEKGITDRTTLSLQDQYALETLERERYFVKSYYTEAGILKEGLQVAKDKNGDILKDENGKNIIIPIAGQVISQEATIALELNKLDSLNIFSSDTKFIEKYRQLTGDNTTSDAKILADKKSNTLNITESQRKELFTPEILPQSFYDLIQEIDNTKGREEAIKALNMNAFIGFKEAFWNNSGVTQGIVDLLKIAKENNKENERDIQDIIDSIEDNQASIRAILKLWAKKGSPSEIDQDMTQASKDNIRDYQELLDSAYEKSKQYIKREYADDVKEGISEANEAFEKELRDLGISILPSDSAQTKLDKLNKQIDEIVKHTTASNKTRLLDDKYQIERYREGKRSQLPLNIERRAGEQEYDLKDDEQYVTFMKLYSESKLLPYYKRYAPRNYRSFTEELRTVSDLTGYIKATLKNPANLIDITPHYSFYDSEDNSTINPNYDTTSRVGYQQPNVNKFKNKSFYEKHGAQVKVKNGRIITETSKNPKLAEVYNAMLDYNESSLDAMGMKDTGYNYYTMPQVRKGGLERFKSLATSLSGEKLRLALKDTFDYNQEEQAQGENYNGIYVIPQPYVQKLRDAKDLATEDLFYSLYMRGKEGYLRKSRENFFGEVNSIQDAVLLRNYNGKAPEATNVYKQAKAERDYQIFGIKQEVTLPFKTAIGTFSGAKIVNNFMKFLSLKNIGFSPIIAITGLGTMQIANWSERWASQYIQNSTYRKGAREFGKLVHESLSELGSINKESKLNVLGEFFGAFDLQKGLKNSQYGWVARTAPKTAMMLYSLSSYPLFGKNMMNTLYDYRIVNGRVINFQSFKQEQRRKGKSIKEVETAFKEYENDPIYNYISVEDGQVNYDKEKLGQVLNLSGEALDKEIVDISNELRAQVKMLNVKIDSQLSEEDKVGIQRHFLWNLLTTYKGFLIVNTESRFKPQQFNTQTRSLEEGSYRSAFAFVGGIIREWRVNGGNILKAVKDEYNGTNKDAEDFELVDLRQSNLKRVCKDMAIANSLMLLSVLLRMYADQPDKKDIWAVQATNLILARLNSEVYQSQVGIYQNYKDILESPVLAYDSAQQLGAIFDSHKTIQILQKNTPILNSYIKIADPLKSFNSLKYQTEVKRNIFTFAPIMYLAPE